MKTPTELASRLAQQWHNADLREQRLLNPQSWPIQLSIGKPAASTVRNHLDQVRQHIERWRKIETGQVSWEKHHYQSTRDAVELPVSWALSTPTEWVNATASPDIRREYQALGRLVQQTDPQFHPFLIRQRSLVFNKPEHEVIKAAELALLLTPGAAQGSPLRAVSLAGIDSKFFERNRTLITRLLDIRFDGQVSAQGLETFLGAQHDNDHWLLVADLDGSLLPFTQQRVRDTELLRTPLAASHLLIIENERCLHQLPTLHGTIAILGAGLNLRWLSAEWLSGKTLGYWGDIDSWGLNMLAQARQHQPGLTPLLMSRAIFDGYQHSKAVAEPLPATPEPPSQLSPEEAQLYRHLLSLKNGRLEQEFIDKQQVMDTVSQWRAHSNP